MSAFTLGALISLQPLDGAASHGSSRRSQVNVFLRLRWGDADNSVLKWVTPRFLSHQRFVKKDVEEVLHYSLANRYIYWMMLLHHFIQHLPCEWSFNWKGPLAHPQQLPTRTQALFGPSSLDDLCFVPLLSPICFTLFTLAYLFSLIDNGRDGILISIVVFFFPPPLLISQHVLYTLGIWQRWRSDRLLTFLFHDKNLLSYSHSESLSKEQTCILV